MLKILFVCHGNICRSPMAEFIFKDMAQKAGVANEFYIASAATSGEEIWGGVGNPVYPPAKRELARHGISCASSAVISRQNCLNLCVLPAAEKMFPIRGTQVIFQRLIQI